MLDLQRHVDCPIWNDILNDSTQSSSAAAQWTGVKYACQKVLQAYCKVFDQEELYDLIVRYLLHLMISFSYSSPLYFGKRQNRLAVRTCSAYAVME